MSARILVVDDNPLNVKLLAAKLSREYYTVLTAENGADALKMAQEEKPDLILLDVQMPEMDGFEVCTKIKADTATRHIPVVMVTALSEVQYRVQGLEAGADDFLTKPFNDVALMARVRSCLRLKSLLDEWRMREGNASAEIDVDTLRSVHIVLIDDQPNECAMVSKHIERAGINLHAVTNMGAARDVLRAQPVDVVMVNMGLSQDDCLKVIANLRANEETRSLPILIYADESDIGRVAKALDLGANDYIFNPIDAMELHARLRTQIRNKRTYDKLRLSYEHNMTMAITDALTGAYNRHYLEQNVPRLFDRYKAGGKAISVVMVDIDFFKKINDTHGHHAGDQILQQVVKRLNTGLRFFDIVIRLGGEEFAIVMPDTNYDSAMHVAERLRSSVAGAPFAVREPDRELPVTISIGVAATDKGMDDANVLFRAADTALYSAKQGGRNKVVGAA